MPSPSAPPGPAGHLILTRSGRATMTRPAAATDLAAVNAMHGRCSPDTIYSRYQTGRSTLREREWAQLTSPEHGVSWVTFWVEAPDTVVAVTHLLHGDTEQRGELALLVEDDWQDAGLGTALTRWALSQAADQGMHGVAVLTAPSNRRMNAICRALGARPAATGGPDAVKEHGDDLVLLELPLTARVIRARGQQACACLSA